MPQNELKKASSEEDKLKIIAIAVTLCVAITLYFRIIEVEEVYTHLFYIPIGLASFWFGKKGFFVALILSLVLLLTHLTMDQLFLNNVMRAFMFCIVGFAVGILSEERNKAENELKKYSERLEEKVEGRTRGLKESKNKIEQLHKVAVQMESTQLEEEVYQLTVDAAEKILEFDMCTLDVVEGNQFVVKATSSELPLKGTVSSSVDEGGMAAKTYRTGKSYLTKDLRKEKEARPSLDEYRSGISIPIGKFGVFQAVSTEVDAFDQEDLELGELLISHTTEALKRIRSEKALQESEEKYRSLTNQLPVGVYRTTGDGKFLHANPALAAILEFESVEDLMKISASDVYNDPRERINQIRQWKTTKEIISNELKFRTKKGREIWIRDTGRVILDENGEISYIDGVIEDITDRKKVEELLKKQREELSAFAHTVSHDLKNYIGIIRNSAQFSLLKKEYAEKNNQRIIDITKKMENFVNRQLELADAGKTIGELEEIDLNKMIDKVRETYSIEIHRGELSMIKGDSLKLKEVFHNLIDNAIKHGKADKIEISSIKKKNSCIIYVKDNGKGIPEEDIDKIFDMRYSKTGTGFGLTIAKKIIEAHDGSISVKSKEGEGTAFEIVLPI